jgi:hypothetical protein
MRNVTQNQVELDFIKNSQGNIGEVAFRTNVKAKDFFPFSKEA